MTVRTYASRRDRNLRSVEFSVSCEIAEDGAVPITRTIALLADIAERAPVTPLGNGRRS